MGNRYQVRVVALTHQGKVRDHNEDTIVFGEAIQNAPMDHPQSFTVPLSGSLLFLVADGMGGHASGEVASQHVAQRLKEMFQTMTLTEGGVATCLQAVNREIYQQMAENRERTGMGTTVAGLLVSPEGVIAFNVGDSRVYRRQNGFLAQISTDDTLRMTVGGEAQRSNRLTQSLGGASSFVEILPHTRRQSLENGRCYLICSDGLTDMIEIDMLEHLVSDDLDAATQSLFEQAMTAGGHDNISIILVRLEPQVASDAPEEALS
jgi:serine/threonine protein phosphatase PrpC